LPQILPFSGIRYADDHLSREVLAPPFDVIDEEQRRALASHPYNIVRLDKRPLGQDDSWYARAAALKDRWLTEGVLQRDASPAFYGYQQTFTVHDTPLTRTGFLARVRLAPWGQGIFPHERTRTGDRDDRLKLTRTMRANLSPVFGLYGDPEGTIDALLGVPEHPLPDHVSLDGIGHTFWRIEDPSTIRALQESLEQRDLVIADGHHRYETALAYQAECRAQGPAGAGPQAYDFVLMYLTNARAPGLVILPTHRVIHQVHVDPELLLHALHNDFDIYPLWDRANVMRTLQDAARDTVALVMATRDMGVFMLRLKSAARESGAPTASPDTVVHSLDVAVLQERILEPHLGISREALAASSNVTYTTNAVEALQQVSDGEAELAFLLNPTSVDQVWQVAMAGLAMPQKSTFFYPKLLTGLVVNPLDVL